MCLGQAAVYGTLLSDSAKLASELSEEHGAVKPTKERVAAAIALFDKIQADFANYKAKVRAHGLP